MVPEPIHYRYAWGRNPLANVQATGNKDLPLATQHSDDRKIEEVPLDVLGDEVGGFEIGRLGVLVCLADRGYIDLARRRFSGGIFDGEFQDQLVVEVKTIREN